MRLLRYSLSSSSFVSFVYGFWPKCQHLVAGTCDRPDGSCDSRGFGCHRECGKWGKDRCCGELSGRVLASSDRTRHIHDHSDSRGVWQVHHYGAIAGGAACDGKYEAAGEFRCGVCRCLGGDRDDQHDRRYDRHAINNETIMQLPSEGRNPQTLLALQPGVLFIGSTRIDGESERCRERSALRPDEHHAGRPG